MEAICFDTMRLWFSLRQNAAGNVDSSNPQQLYERWRRVAEQGDYGDRYARSLRNDLFEAVRLGRVPPVDHPALGRWIEQRPMDEYAPEMLRLDLSWIADRRGCTVDELLEDCHRRARALIYPPQEPQPDEYFSGDLPLSEFAAWCTLL